MAPGGARGLAHPGGTLPGVLIASTNVALPVVLLVGALVALALYLAARIITAGVQHQRRRQ